MLFRIAVLLSVLAGTAAQAAESVRIALYKNLTSVRIQGTELQKGADVEEPEFSSVASDTVVALNKGQLMVNGTAQTENAVRLHAPDPAVITVNTLKLRGDVVVLSDGSKLTVVNVLPLEDYLTGVLGGEMPRSFPLEALKAQAVASRTFALHKKLLMVEQPYYLESSVISQVYKGLEVEDPVIRSAVQATRGQVLTYLLQPAETYFHASCGGKTETGTAALNRDLPYLKSVSCGCGKLAQLEWGTEVTAAELQRAFGRKATTLRVIATTSTGHAQQMLLGPELKVSAVTFREKLGYSRVRSLLFVVKPSGKNWKVSGHGFGHGAGMCQWGAKLFAEQGWTYEKILAHYYPSTELQTLY